jgi:hypothetical protein
LDSGESEPAQREDAEDDQSEVSKRDQSHPAFDPCSGDEQGQSTNDDDAEDRPMVMPMLRLWASRSAR